MDSAKLNDWMQVTGLFALVASLIFIGMQMRQDRILAAIDSIASRADSISELTDMISDNRELWVSALNGDELSEADRATFQAMVESVESYFFSLGVRVQGNNSGFIGGSIENVTGSYAYALYTHKGLRRSWDRQLEYWQIQDSTLGTIDPGSGFRSLVNEKLDHFDKVAPRLPNEKRYVFW